MNTVRANDTLMAIVTPIQIGDHVACGDGWAGTVDEIDYANNIAIVRGLEIVDDENFSEMPDGQYDLNDLIRTDYEDRWAA